MGNDSGTALVVSKPRRGLAQRLIGLLVPRPMHFYDHLEVQATIAHRAAQTLSDFRTRPVAEVCRAIQDIEHEGDRVVHELEEALALTFVTPIDREDLQGVSSDLDNVTDRINDASMACDLMSLERPTNAMFELIVVLQRATAKLTEAVPLLRKGAYEQVITLAREVRTLESEGDQIYRTTIRALYDRSNPIDAKQLMREETVLEDLETAIDDCEHVADRLIHLSVKHG